MSNAQVLENMMSLVGSGGIEVVDLTNTLSPDFPVLVLPEEFAQCAPFKRETISQYNDKGPMWYWNNISMNEHTGTHFDAPVHWVTGKDLPDATVDKLAAKEFIGHAVVMDFTAECAADADFVLTAEHIQKWEEANGTIPEQSWIMFHTGWASKVGTEAYTNLQEDGAHTPGPDPSAIDFLVHQRNCKGLGVETIGTDAGQGHVFEPPYPAHNILHGNGRYGLQCLTNLDKLPAFGTIIIASPLKIEDGSGSPLRVIALVAK